MIQARSSGVWGGISWVWSPAWSSAEWMGRGVWTIFFTVIPIAFCVNLESAGVLCRYFAGSDSRVRASQWSVSNSIGVSTPSVP